MFCHFLAFTIARLVGAILLGEPRASHGDCERPYETKLCCLIIKIVDNRIQ